MQRPLTGAAQRDTPEAAGHFSFSATFTPVGFGIEVSGYNARPVFTRWLAALTLAVLLLLASSAPPARGESSLSLSPPDRFGEIAADTYDEEGRRVGDANLRVERLPGGNVLMEVLSGIDGSAQFAGSAELAPNGPDGTMRLVRERTQAVDETEKPMGVTTIDHVAGVAQCGKPEGSETSPRGSNCPPTTGW